MIDNIRILEEINCRTLNDFIVLGNRRGYKSPYGWAVNKMKGRTERERVRTQEATDIYRAYERVNYGYAD